MINPPTGFDIGEIRSPTQTRAMSAYRGGAGADKPPSRPGGGGPEGGGGGRIGAVLGALSVVGDIYLIWKFGQAMGSENPGQAMHQLQCDVFGYDPIYPGNAAAVMG